LAFGDGNSQTLAHYYNVSGAALAVVVAGIYHRNKSPENRLVSKHCITNVDKFLGIIDVLLNALLFRVLIGLELLIISFESQLPDFGLLRCPCFFFAIFKQLLARCT